MKAYLVQNRKNLFVLEFVYLPYAWLFLWSPSSYLSFSAGVLITDLSGNVLPPTLVYPGLLLGFCFGPSIGQTPRYGLDRVDRLSSLLLGLDRDLFGLSGRHKSSQKGYQLYSNYFYSARWSLYAHFICKVTICMIIFMHKLLEFTVGKLALAFGLFCMERHHYFFQHEELLKLFFSSSFVTVYFVNVPAIVLLKSYDLQYLKQMSIALYFHPIFIEWARYESCSLPLS